jgi:hypothetical protein
VAQLEDPEFKPQYCRKENRLEIVVHAYNLSWCEMEDDCSSKSFSDKIKTGGSTGRALA